MPLSTKPYKGARDFYPDAKRFQKYMFATMRSVVESFGYEEYDAPIIESLDLYLAKTGEEIVNEQTYSFTDRGGRQVAIRPEMTPTVSRMVAAKRQEMAYPLRWYSIPNLWRYERPQRGRLREHWQLNVDVFGIEDTQAEIEIIAVADRLLKEFGARREMYDVRVNSRQLMDYLLLDYLKMDKEQTHSMSRLIDRMHKIELTEFITEADLICNDAQRANGIIEKLINILKAKNIKDLPVEVEKHPSVDRLNNLLLQLESVGITNVTFDASLMRGFDYYTDIIFEIFDTHLDNNRSIMGGGRYDGLIEYFGVEKLPTVGFGLGDVTLANFLELHNLMPLLTVETEIFVIIIGSTLNEEISKTITRLREMGIKLAVGVVGRKIGDQLKVADKKDIPYVLIIGENELADQQFTLKHLKSGQEEKHSLERIVSIVKDYRQSKVNDRY